MLISFAPLIHDFARKGADPSLPSAEEDEEFCRRKLGRANGMFQEAQPDEKEEIRIATTKHNHGKSQEDSSSLLASLKACTKHKDLFRGCQIHETIERRELFKKDVRICSAIINMYAKCGALAKAQEVFDGLHTCNTVSWNALIAGYVQNGYAEEALNRFELMQPMGVTPDAATYVSILKACGLMGAVEKGKELHAEIVHNGWLETNYVVANALVDMYAKCGLLSESQDVFDELLVRDVVSWSALICGYAEHNHGQQALRLFELMKLEGLYLDAVTFLCALKACGSMGVAGKGQEIHAQIVREGVFEKDILVGTAVVDMYAKCGSLVEAQAVFDKLLVRNIIPWTALITGHVQHGFGEEALNCFDRMRCEGLFPNANTFSCISKACGISRAADRGQQIHAEIVKNGLLEKDVVLGTALVDMYANCGDLLKVQKVFDELPFRNVFSWNAVIVGYVRHGHSEEAVSYFEQMQLEGFSPDAITFACILKACGSIGAVAKGKETHAEILREGLFENNILVANALVSMYAKCGLLQEAEDLFDDLREKDVVSWNALGAGFIQHELYEEALMFFERMQQEGFFPDVGTFLWALKACSSMGAAGNGQNQHSKIVREGWLEKDTAASTTLVEMYSRCGMLMEAQEMFDKFTAQDLFSWNALIDGYAQFGKDEAVFSLFDRMIREGKEPDMATFAMVLNTCSHSGSLDRGQSYFDFFSTCHRIYPHLEHYTCIVDLFGRAGCLDEAVAVMQNIPIATDCMVYHSMLGACRKWEYARLGEWTFGHAAQMTEMDVALYVCLCNIYSAAGKEEDADEIDDMKVEKQVSEEIWTMSLI